MYIVKGEMGFFARDISRSHLRLLRSDEVLEEKKEPESLRRIARRKGAVEKPVKLSKRDRSYRKAQEEIRRQDQAVGLIYFSL